MSSPWLQPVILGGDIGAYSLARTFHEAYGVRSVVVSSASTGLVRHSAVLESVVEPRMDDDDVLVARLLEIADQHAGRELILLGSADWLVRAVVVNRERLEGRYVVPYVPLDVLDRVTDKAGFSALCTELDIAHPQTVVVEVGAHADLDTSALTFPVIAKAGSTAGYHLVEFAGKKKVYTVASHAELVALLDQVAAAGYSGTFLVQDFIPGDDSQMRILTCFSDRAGTVRFASFGHVLLEEHTPGALGNPAAIITEPNPQVVAQAVRLLEHIGWTGFSNFDLKVDPRDGRTVFFELNPRLGRSNYYVTAAGRNTAEAYVREYLEQRAGLEREDGTGLVEQQATHLYTVLPRPLLLRYVFDRALRGRARGLFRQRRVSNPLWYSAERHPRRIAYVIANQVNQFRKFARHYPLSALEKAQWRP
ncbi:MAG: carboxylate--amine ligase [Actinomycetales bacterium]|nr:carboxylate--amine ligase [Actinomycetales bacterium]